MTNPAHIALTNAVNRAIAEGAPVYVNQPADWIVSNHGTIILFTPLTEAAIVHAKERFPDDCMMFGGSYAVEHRYADDIITDLAQHDFVLG